MKTTYSNNCSCKNLQQYVQQQKIRISCEDDEVSLRGNTTKNVDELVTTKYMTETTSETKTRANISAAYPLIVALTANDTVTTTATATESATVATARVKVTEDEHHRRLEKLPYT